MDKSEIADLLDGLELFRDFTYGELKIISRFLIFETKAAGEVIFNEGDPGTFMLILAEGRVSVFKGGEQGKHLLSYEGRGRFLGEMALLDRELRSATCVTETACKILTLDQGTLDRMENDCPRLAYRFTLCLARLLSRRLRKASGMLVEYLVS